MLKRVFALGATVLLAGSLMACNTAQNRELGYAPGEGQDQVGTAQVREGEQGGAGVEELKNLQPGQNTAYYIEQFNRMGFMISDVRETDEGTVYDLRKDNQRVEVSLNKPANQDQVQAVNVQEYRAISTEQKGEGTGAADKDVSAVINRVRGMQTGMMPYEYIPAVSQIGQVTEYEMNRNNAELEFRADDRHYTMTMDTDPNTGRVTSIEVDRQVWAL